MLCLSQFWFKIKALNTKNILMFPHFYVNFESKVWQSTFSVVFSKTLSIVLFALKTSLAVCFFIAGISIFAKIAVSMVKKCHVDNSFDKTKKLIGQTSQLFLHIRNLKK